MITGVNASGMEACEGRVNTPMYKIQCCDEWEFCNRGLDIVVGPTDADADTSPGESCSRMPAQTIYLATSFLYMSKLV